MSECRYVTIYNGEQWCDEHDSAAPCPGDVQPSPEQRAEFAGLVEQLAKATEAVTSYWQDHLPDDIYTPETGYPYSASLDEVSQSVWDFADAVLMDARQAKAEHPSGECDDANCRRCYACAHTSITMAVTAKCDQCGAEVLGAL